MDRKIEKSKRSRVRLGAFVVLIVLGLAAFYGLLSYFSVSRLVVNPDRLRIATVERGSLKPSGGEATLLRKGAFFETTGGNWVYLVDEAAAVAVRRPVRFGDQSLEFYEVLSGLEPGDRVITSSYDHFGDVEQLVLRK